MSITTPTQMSSTTPTNMSTANLTNMPSESHMEVSNESHMEMPSESHMEMPSESHMEMSNESHMEVSNEKHTEVSNTDQNEMPRCPPVTPASPIEDHNENAKQTIQIKINRMTEKHLVGVHQLQNNCFKGGEAYTLEVIQMLHQSCPFQFVAVTEPEEEIVGLLITMPSCEWKDMLGLTIASFAIHENFRGRGLGRVVLTTFLQITDNLTMDNPITGKTIAPDVVLQVRVSNATAINLYQQMGFIQDPEILHNYYSGPCEDAYIMYKRGQPLTGVNHTPVAVKQPTQSKSPQPPQSKSPQPPQSKSPQFMKSKEEGWNNYLVWGLTGLTVALTSLAIGAKLMRGSKSDPK
jgi:ribosomal protein S18 acetylase RimI-like enzyme